MLKKYPLMTRVGLFLVLPTLIAVVYVYQLLDNSQPKYTGQLKLQGLDSQVDIRFDAKGVPQVTAQTDEAAYFAQGYLHASERMWQMELQRRLVEGRLSEIFGEQALSSDIWMRTLGLFRVAPEAYQSVSRDAKLALDAYSRGVNAWLKSTPVLPPEFVLFDIEPKPWQATDSLAWQKVFALNLGQNMYQEVNRLTALKVIDEDQLKTFFPHDPPNIGSELSRSLDAEPRQIGNHDRVGQFADWTTLASHFADNWALGERFAGSNGWVVSGQHTRSGAPILANDPHLSIAQPSLWYALQLKGDQLDAMGMSLVGLPGVILGRNQAISWGVTALMGDQQDLFILDIPLGRQDAYATKQGLQPITVHEEVIVIKQDSPQILNEPIEPLTVQIRTTALGPVVSDVVRNTNHVVALRWSALDSQDQSFESFYRLQYAKDWSQFGQAVSLLKAPGLHFMYADNQGNIGSQVAGKMPIRGKGTGVLPQRADDENNYWQGYQPFERLPRQYNPASGVIVSANNKIDSQPGVVLSHEWAPMTRNNRISALLNEQISQGKKLTINDMLTIQQDQLDSDALSLLPFFQREAFNQMILDNLPNDLVESGKLALNELAHWDGRYSIDSPAATVYHYWNRSLKQEIFVDELTSPWLPLDSGRLAQRLIGRVADLRVVELLKGQGDKIWCLQSPDHIAPCEQELYESFKSTLKSLDKNTRSTDVEDWAWGKLHYVEFSHRPLGQIKALAKLFSTRVPVGGNSNSLNVANANAVPEGGFKQTFGAVFRQIFDMGVEQGNVFMLTPGQSGHIMSEHYGDMIMPFIEGQLNHYGSGQPWQSELASSGQTKHHSTRLMTLLPGGQK